MIKFDERISLLLDKAQRAIESGDNVRVRLGKIWKNRLLSIIFDEEK